MMAAGVRTVAGLALLLLLLTGCDKTPQKTSADALAAFDACGDKARSDFLQGLALYERKEYGDAAAMFDAVRRACPQAPCGWHGAFIIALVQGSGDEARRAAETTIEHLEIIKKHRPARWDGYLEFLYGVCLAAGLHDTDKAREHYKRSCELGEGRGCSNYGKLFEKTNQQTAWTYYEKGCELGYGRACTNKGVLAETTDRHPGVALNAYKKGCGLKHATGCRNAGLLLETRGETALAAQWFGKGCELGDRESCSRRKSLKK